MDVESLKKKISEMLLDTEYQNVDTDLFGSEDLEEVPKEFIQAIEELNKRDPKVQIGYRIQVELRLTSYCSLCGSNQTYCQECETCFCDGWREGNSCNKCGACECDATMCEKCGKCNSCVKICDDCDHCKKCGCVCLSED